MLNKIIKCFVFTLSFFLLNSFTSGSIKNEISTSPKIIAVKGDFNGDGKIDSMWLVPPKIVTNEPDCLEDCKSYIKFSDTNIPSIKIENCIGGVPTNLGDLNNNGTDEIGLLPEWFTSNWCVYFVWTYIGGKWVEAVPPFATYTSQWEKGVIPIEVDKTKKGNVVIRYSDFVNDNIVTLSKSVRILK